MSDARFDASYGTNPAQNYERFFVPAIGAPVADALLRLADIHPNDRVLDVACGTGIVIRRLWEAREARDAGGGLAGLDPNPSMLEVARAAAPTAPIEWIQAAAESMPIPSGSFDVVLCQMGLQFMEDRSAAIAEMHRVLADRGRLLFSVPGPIGGFFAILASAMERHIGQQAGGFVRQVFSLHDVDELEHLLGGAGFVDVDVVAAERVLELPSPREFLWQYVHSTPLSAVVSQAGAEAADALEREVLEASAELTKGEAMEQRQRVVVAFGVRAGA